MNALFQVTNVASFDALDVASYLLSLLTLVFSFIYARAFLPFIRHEDAIVRYLCCAVTISCSLLGFYTLFWDVILRTIQLIEDGQFRYYRLGPIGRMHYMAFHFFGFALVSWRLGQFLQLTIPPHDRKDFPWWKAPFYPNRRIFW